MLHPSLQLPAERVEELCRRYHVRELSVFGSAVRDDFRPDSDVDFLVEFSPDGHVSLLDLIRMERELRTLIGRETDLVSKGGLNPLIRDEVLASSEVVYAA